MFNFKILLIGISNFTSLLVGSYFFYLLVACRLLFWLVRPPFHSCVISILFCCLVSIRLFLVHHTFLWCLHLSFSLSEFLVFPLSIVMTTFSCNLCVLCVPVLISDVCDIIGLIKGLLMWLFYHMLLRHPVNVFAFLYLISHILFYISITRQCSPCLRLTPSICNLHVGDSLEITIFLFLRFQNKFLFSCHEFVNLCVCGSFSSQYTF